MSWPPSLPVDNGGFKAEGFTTIVWGTEGFQQGALASYIVVSARPAQRVEGPTIENGTGLTATKILLIDGVDQEITVVDDTSISPPAVGSVLSLISPFGSNTGNYLVVNNSYAAARKQPGERTILVQNYTLFAVI